MPRNRKYSDAQREAVLRLHYLGHRAPEIVRQCASGEAGPAPFQIPRRTVSQLITTAGKRAGTGTIATLSDAEVDVSIEANTRRIQALLTRELSRLERRDLALSMDDLNKLERVRAMNERLRNSQGRSRLKASSVPSKKKRASAIDGLASRLGSREEEAASARQEIRNGDTSSPSIPSRHGGTPSTLEPEPVSGTDIAARQVAKH